MAKVSIKFGNPDGHEVQVRLTATALELRQFTEHNPASHAVAYRLHEAIHTALSKLTTIVEQEIES